MINLLFNLLLLVVWTRLFSVDRTAFYYNPYIAWINQISRTVVQWGRSVFPRLSPVYTALSIVVVVLVVRAVILPTERFEGWTLTFGFLQSAPKAGAVNRLMFSLASFGMILFYLSAIHGVLHRYTHGVNQWDECLGFLIGPFADARRSRRWWVLAGLGLAVSVALVAFAHPLRAGSAWAPGMVGMPRVGWRLIVNTAAALIGVLPVMQAMLMVMIIGSWITLVSPSDELTRFCHEGVAYLIGPLRRYRLAVGPLDLTPLLALMLMMVMHAVAMGLLQRLF